MTVTPDLRDQRKEFAAAFKQANEQLRIAQGIVQNKTLETALWGWRWGRAVNDLHGSDKISREQMSAYCAELGVATDSNSQGQPRGRGTVYILRRVAARVLTEDHLRELLTEHRTIWVVAEAVYGPDHGDGPNERSRTAQRSRRSAKPATGYSKFVPPQSWVSYLMEQQMTRGEISAALCLSLEALGPEESFKLWDRAGRPDRYDQQ